MSLWQMIPINYCINHLSVLSYILICFQLFFVYAQQQQQQISPINNKLPKSLWSTGEAQHNKLLPNHALWKKTNLLKQSGYDASAVATLSRAESAVAAPYPPLSSGIVAENFSPQTVRNLGEWEVEDFVLLATIDGTLHARHRSTGEQIWQTSYEQPMVQIKYQSKSLSSPTDSSNNIIIDDYLWILDPSKNGNIYVYRPNGLTPGLINTGLTMKKLVEMTPYGNEDPPVVYTGEKKTNVLTVDAHTGRVLSWFGSMDSLLAKETCKIEESNIAGTKKCTKPAKIILGHTEYTVGIFGKHDSRHIATLKLSEWTPNNYDQDLQRQYMQYGSTLDNKYIYTGHDGSFVSFSHKSNIGADDSGLLFWQKLSSPVVRVFDVARPCGSREKGANLIILDQPQPPFDKEKQSKSTSSSKIFLNHTEDGSWYAIPADQYPSATSGIQAALCNQDQWLEFHPWNISNKRQLSEALVGLHSVENYKFKIEDEIYTISGPIHQENLTNLSSLDSNASLNMEYIALLSQILQLLRKVMQSSIGILRYSFLLFLPMVFIFLHKRRIRLRSLTHPHETGQPITSNLKFPNSSPIRKVVFSHKVMMNNKTLTHEVNQCVDDSTNVWEPAKINLDEYNDGQEKVKSKLSISEDSALNNSDFATQNMKKEKKTHSGRCGGMKHRKKARKKAFDITVISKPEVEFPPPLAPPDSGFIHNSSVPSEIDSNFQSKPCNTSKSFGSLDQIGLLEVDTDKLLGTGSNGTMVFQGRFDGREVAVKRMLIQFFDIASQETKLLRESDDHPNVIRYFAQQQTAGFLYIALELYPASLADIIEKPHNHSELAQASERDLPNILYQVTNGLRHLHNLRIVHRDLKPQNILVSVGNDNKPRLVVSDFGLCKKLEGEQSFFRATTAYAAGTSGWRAPELLLGDDAKDGRFVLVDATTEDNSNTTAMSPESLPNRRATQAIDIFSLGLIFFYVLTKGSHPYDCGDRFMREVNIRKGKYDLNPLEVLGDYTYEAKELIGSMLDADPKRRPQADQVMAHPFFWSSKKKLDFLCDVSDHFEKERRDPPTEALQELESYAYNICGKNFLKALGRDFVESLGRQRKYTGTRLLDLLRALRNKKNHYEDLNDKLKKELGPLPDGYLSFWTRRFPQLLVVCWTIVYDLQWDKTDRFKEYYEPATA
ncbi:putative serine threonine-protein kinase [Erysiphe neolycopersici]|uniref:non-specific serine/threonine protein kinase n=1 Tax=Erysiphe neolycopersici TaxID=212602 RepID=A0A420HZM7_9PEZI|nr:putative serine threonine-protein kinase [Erysiphe neolycopersici]